MKSKIIFAIAVVWAQIIVSTPGQAQVGSRGFFKDVGLITKQLNSVTLFSLKPQIGDYLISVAPFFDDLHQLYPTAAIRAPMTVNPNLFQSSAQFSPEKFKIQTPITLDFFKYLEKLKNPAIQIDNSTTPLGSFSSSLLKQIASEVEASDLFVYDAFGFGWYVRRMANAVGYPGDPIENHQVWNAIELIDQKIKTLLTKSGNINLYYDWNQKPVAFAPKDPELNRRFQEWVPPPRRYFRQHEAIYANAADVFENLFGTRDMLLPPSYFKPHSSKAEVVAFFEGKVTNPQAEFILINLNSGDPGKSISSALEQYKILKYILESVDKEFSNANILLTPYEPVPHLDEARQRQVDDNLRKINDLLASTQYKGRVAYLPESKELWSAATIDARVVISRDSGFVHLANEYRGSGRSVITISHDEESERWRLPEQPYLTNFTTLGSYAKPSTHYLDQALSKLKSLGAPKNCRAAEEQVSSPL